MLVVAIVNDEARLVPGAATIDVDWPERMWSRPGVKPESDVAIVVNDRDEVCASVSLTCQHLRVRIEVEGAMRRADQGRGLGKALLAQVTRRSGRLRARAGPTGQAIQGLTLVGVAEIDPLMATQGLRAVRCHIQMETLLVERPAPPGPMPVISLRPYVASDVRGAHARIAPAFADHWGDPQPGLEESQRRIDDTSPWPVATVEDEVVGVIAAVRNPPDRGPVSELGVLAAWRGRGVGGALLRAALRSLRAAGLAGAHLHVEGERLTGATRLYEGVGMTGRPSFMWWEHR